VLVLQILPRFVALTNKPSVGHTTVSLCKWGAVRCKWIQNDEIKIFGVM